MAFSSHGCVFTQLRHTLLELTCPLSPVRAPGVLALVSTPCAASLHFGDGIGFTDDHCHALAAGLLSGSPALRSVSFIGAEEDGPVTAEGACALLRAAAASTTLRRFAWCVVPAHTTQRASPPPATTLSRSSAESCSDSHMPP